jgi:hypothetical protein
MSPAVSKRTPAWKEDPLRCISLDDQLSSGAAHVYVAGDLRANLSGFVTGLSSLPCAAYAVDERSPGTCEMHHVRSVAGHLSTVRSCSGDLALPSRHVSQN